MSSHHRSQDDTPPLLPGDHVLRAGAVVAERYKVVRAIGSGGSAEVYEAVDLELGGRVALKTLRPSFGESDRERFLQEIKLARRVTHPNVCRMIDLGIDRKGTEQPLFFLTMELLPGETLAARLQARGRFPVAEVEPILRQLVAGLRAAHQAGVIHRDLKPGNIMLCPPPSAEAGERVVIMDFGLARSEHDRMKLTATNEMVGTPLYMSPEQVENQAITAATDVYALGIVIYELLSGELPFREATPLATALVRTDRPPRPIRQHLPDLDPRWEAAVHRCLERVAERRFADVGDVLASLDGPAPPPGRGGLWRLFRRGG